MSSTSLREARYSDSEVLTDPYPYFAAMRSGEPVYREPSSGMFFISKYEDVVFASQHPELFSSRRRAALTSSDPEIAAIRAQGFPDSIGVTATDPPEHKRFRALVMRVLKPQRFRSIEGKIRDYANTLVDAFIAEGKADLAQQFAGPLPLRVIADLLDLDHADVPKLKRWSDNWTAQIAALSNPLPRERAIECAQSTNNMQHYFSDVIAARRKAPGDDLVSELLAVNDAAPEPIDHAMLVDMLRIFLIGGNDTTTNAIATLIYRLLDDPENYRRVEQDRSLIPIAIEEGLRCESPSQWNPRIATQDIELGGTTIPAGSAVALLWGSANRDENQFGDAAATFSLDRGRRGGHLAFGMGPHSCAGSSLARLELQISLDTIFARLKNLRLADRDPAEFVVHPILRGMKHLYVTFDPAPAG